ncbi:hypothetical protein PsorP6_016096 [Peronosclerospora sorghi]|uniref:Uncharacterized protein n=1 Tax=Peronosclerospora sorghi TaxID=230839 RepID=A0ACC0WNS9_9STRA|nr:hypothetical protein PsorP6_016096 [Peronosclerospora sorghi]
MENTPSAQDFLNGIMAIVQRQQEIIEEMRQQREVPREVTYYQSQNIDMFDDRYLNYAIYLITINLRGAAEAWNQDFVQGGGVIESIQQLQNLMSQEFVPVDIQERLLEKIDNLKQKKELWKS